MKDEGVIFFMLASKTRWKESTYASEQRSEWQEQLGVSSLVANLLFSRGCSTVEEAHQMLNMKDIQFHDPFLLDGMKQAVERIQDAIKEGQKIRIYGDYDCDGVTSTTIMIYVLRELNAHFDFYIPNRFTEGYGLNNGALDQAKAEEVDLVITVDTGISAREQIAYGASIGLEFVVTDHHEPPPFLPECVALINPKLSTCSYPYKYLAGAGVAFKLAHALLARIPSELVDLAAIGTIADLVPLTGENRLLAYHGLNSLNSTKHIGIGALLEVAGLTDEVINERHVGFALGPRINASGRLETADKAVQLLVATDRAEAQSLAQEIDSLNKERQATVDEITKEAIQWVEVHYPSSRPKALVVAMEGWNAGVIGIVASRLVERYYLPTIVLSIDPENGLAKGSARSIDGFDMYQALVECKEWLPHFGGHPMAAGMTLETENIDRLRIRLDQIAEQCLTEDNLKPITLVDVCCSIEDITLKAIEELSRLAPYGVGNPKPTILLKKVKIKEMKQVGAEQQHLKCQLEQEGAVLDGIGFSLGDAASKISIESLPDVIGQVEINEWNGSKKPQIMIKDLRVLHRQFFDWRGAKQIEKKWQRIYFDRNVAIVNFRPDGVALKDVPSEYHSISFDSQGQKEDKTSFVAIDEVDTFVLADIPQSIKQLREVCESIRHGKRFYLIFDHQEDHFLSTSPNREDFKWYYALLQKQEPFDLKVMGSKLAKHKGWSLESIQFMTEVFLELQFAKLVDGKIYLHDQPVRKDLDTSKLVQQKQEDMRIEQELIYSSYSELIQLLEQFMKDEKKEGKLDEKKEGVIAHGF